MYIPSCVCAAFLTSEGIDGAVAMWFVPRPAKDGQFKACWFLLSSYVYLLFLPIPHLLVLNI